MMSSSRGTMALVISSSRAGLDAHGVVYFHAIDTTMCAALARQAARTALEAAVLEAAAWVGVCVSPSMRKPAWVMLRRVDVRAALSLVTRLLAGEAAGEDFAGAVLAVGERA